MDDANKTPPQRRRIDWRETFASLRYPNYRLWFYGQLASLVGTWMQSAAQSYLVYELTHSSFYLGLVGLAAGAPTWILTLYGGVVADRVSRRNLLVITQTAMMLLAFILAALTFLHVVRPFHILILAACLGVANAFEAPARQAFVLEMVERRYLTNAIALNAMMFNTAVALGPAAGGLIYAGVGPAWCFTINGLSFIAVIAALLAMRLTPQPRPERRGAVVDELVEGMRYVFTHQAVRTLIFLVAVVSLFALSFVNLVPAWANKILHGGATTNGLLLSARGLGAVAGALVLVVFSHYRIKGKLLTIGTVTFPVFLLIFAYIRQLPLALVVLALVGATSILVINLANALVQSLVPDALRGRAMGVYTFIFFGTMPLGSLWVGGLAHRFNEMTPLVIGSLLSLLAAGLVYTFAPWVRRLE